MTGWETPEKRRERLYREQRGEPRNLPEDHPDRWMWEYTGSKADKEKLLVLLGIEERDDEQPTQEETLWDG